MKITPGEIKKAIMCAVTFLTGAVAQGLIVGKAALIATLIVGTLATAGVYGFENKDKPAGP